MLQYFLVKDLGHGVIHRVELRPWGDSSGEVQSSSSEQPPKKSGASPAQHGSGGWEAPFD